MKMWGVLKDNIRLHTFDHKFGIVVACPTGLFWENQTQGVLCHHVVIEGIFIPLPFPEEILQKLQEANYNYDKEKITEAWRELKEILAKVDGLVFEEVDAPEGFPENQEGLQWIKIIAWRNPADERHKLEGEIVALYYPNCD